MLRDVWVCACLPCKKIGGSFGKPHKLTILVFHINPHNHFVITVTPESRKSELKVWWMAHLACNQSYPSAFSPHVHALVVATYRVISSRLARYNKQSLWALGKFWKVKCVSVVAILKNTIQRFWAFFRGKRKKWDPYISGSLPMSPLLGRWFISISCFGASTCIYICFYN